MLLTLLSPAKKLKTSVDVEALSEPTYINNASILIKVLQKKSVIDLKKLMKISDDIAELNSERYLSWSKDHSAIHSSPAGFLFDGEVYRGLDISSFDSQEIVRAQEQLRILSGLYGMLRPMDGVYPYRLEMGTKLKFAKFANLYEFWKKSLTQDLCRDIVDKEISAIVNLASTEYFKVIDMKQLNIPIITPVFKDNKNGSYKTIMVYAKKARGRFASFIIKNNITDRRNLVAFDCDGYQYSEEDSTESTLTFLRG